MEKDVFYRWCCAATRQIRYGPDRKAVYAELRAHLEDHRDALIEQGMTAEEATAKALESMGSAEKIAPQLAAIHTPFWGYFQRVCQILLAVLLVLCLYPLWDYATDLHLGEPHLLSFEIYDSASYGGDTGRTLHYLSHPNVSFSTDGSTFTLTDAAVFTRTITGSGTEKTYLYVLIRQTSPLPWTEHDEYTEFFNISGWFTARDSLGNTYESYLGRSGGDTPHVNTAGMQSGIFTSTHECWINDFPADAQWVDICYERDGRSCQLRVYLTGGERS